MTSLRRLLDRAISICIVKEFESAWAFDATMRNVITTVTAKASAAEKAKFGNQTGRAQRPIV